MLSWYYQILTRAKTDKALVTESSERLTEQPPKPINVGQIPKYIERTDRLL